MNKNWMATTIAAAIVALAPAGAGAAVVSGFTGPFAPATFTTTPTGNVAGGSAVFTPTTLTLRGGDDPSVNPDIGPAACLGAVTGIAGACQISTTHALVGSADTVTFHWSYATTDISPETDLFGVLINGVRTVLSAPGGALTQSGDYTFASTGSFGFFVNCTDCIGGAATATISAFQVAVVPEPATIALMGAGLAVFGATRRRTRRGVATA